MAQREVSDAERLAKFFVFLGSLALGIAVGVFTYVVFERAVLGAAVGLLAGIANAFAAGAVAGVCEALHHWAFPDTYAPWSVDRRAAHGGSLAYRTLFLADRVRLLCGD